MNTYLLIVLFVIGSTFLTYMTRNIKIKFADKSVSLCKYQEDFSNSSIFLFANAILLIVITGLRNRSLSVDYSNYEYNYIRIIKQTEVKEILRGKEAIFGLINKAVGTISDYNIIWLMMILAILTVYFLFKGCKEYSETCWLFVFLLVTMGSYYTSFNTTRNYLAAVMFFYSCRYIYEEKFWHYLLFVIIIIGIHISAIVLLPLYWILQIRWNKSRVKLALGMFGIIASIIIYINFQSFVQWITTFVYMVYRDGTSIPEVSMQSLLRPVCFLFLIIIFYRKFDFDKVKDCVWFNAVIYFLISQVLSFQFTIVYRFTYFFIPLSLMAMCHIVAQIKRKSVRIIVIGGLIIVGFLYSFAGQFQLPYKFYWE